MDIDTFACRLILGEYHTPEDSPGCLPSVALHQLNQKECKKQCRPSEEPYLKHICRKIMTRSHRQNGSGRQLL